MLVDEVREDPNTIKMGFHRHSSMRFRVLLVLCLPMFYKMEEWLM